MRSVFLLAGYLVSALSLPANAQEMDVSGAMRNLQSPREAERIEAIETLGRLRVGTDEAILALSRLLKDKSPLVRAHTVFALAEIGTPARAAIPQLLSLAGDPDVRVRRVVVRAIGRIRPGPEVSIPVLLRMMGDSDPAVRIRAIDAVADLGQPAVPHLIRVLKDEGVRYWAILALGQMGQEAKAALPDLVQIAADRKLRPELRREAVLALGEMGEAAASAVPQLREALQDNQLQGAAVYALGRLGPPAKDAVAPLEKIAQSDEPFLRAMSAWALARIRPEDRDQMARAVEELTGALKSEKQQVREAAAKALVGLNAGPEIVIPAIDKALRGANEATVAAALDALAAFGQAAIPQLIDALRYPSVRPQAIRLLGQLGPAAQPAVAALVDLLTDDNPETRREAALTLGEIGPTAKEAVPALIDVLRKDEDRIRYGAVYALGRIGPSALAAKPFLAASLESKDQFLALACAWALARIDPQCQSTNPAMVPLLIEGLKESDPRIRMEAAAALRCLGPLARPAIDALSQATRDENAFVRDMAVEALEAVTGTKPAAGSEPPAPQP